MVTNFIFLVLYVLTAHVAVTVSHKVLKYTREEAMLGVLISLACVILVYVD